MEKIYSITDLNNSILLLENKQAVEEGMLKEQFHLTYESIKPINLIKNILKETTESDEIKENFINNSIGITAGYLSKIVFETVATSPLKKLVGSAVMFSVKNAVAHNPKVIKSLASGFLKMISGKKNS